LSQVIKKRHTIFVKKPKGKRHIWNRYWNRT